MIAKSWWGGCLVGAFSIGIGSSVLAQIVPDSTLGAESSVVTPDNIGGIESDRIDGGATRGANLFHSFQEFNVGEARGVYFTNPTGIENILTRVTGSNSSNILGRLGVLGEANLLLLNPNGIIFGSKASLDIQGSFVATTAERIQLGDSGYFSATQPQTSSLLSVSPGALFFSQAASQPTAIINQGNLTTEKNLTLSADNLDLQGQLQAGGDLTLQAQDTVKVRDSVTVPFLARSGENLTIIGDRGIDILALNHPTQTPFVSGGNLSLSSDGIISGDAHFSSGGSFSLKSVSGRLANFVSYYDPIISALGDVDVAANYTGTSLLVESGGNIRFQGDINITGPDTSTLPLGSDTAALSTTSTLIMRSGQRNLAYGGVNGTIPVYGTGSVPAGITIGRDVTLQPFNGSGGIVDLLAASGNVSTRGMTTNGGAIRIEATGGNINTGDLASFSSSPDDASEGGAIRLEATGGNINTGYLNSNSYSVSGNAGEGGAILLQATGGISTGFLDSASFSVYGNAREGGDITLQATSGSIKTDGYLKSFSSASGNASEGGAIRLEATGGSINTGYLNSNSFSVSGNAGKGGAILLQATSGISTGFLDSASFSVSGNTGRGGDITLQANGGSINTGDLNSKSPSTLGNAGGGGAIRLEANGGSINTGDLASFSSASGNASEGGAIRLEATGSIDTGFLDSKSSSASGNAGRGGGVTLQATGGSIKIDYLNSFSSASGNAGRGGDITLQATSGSIKTGDLASFSSSPDDASEGGAILLQATGGSINTGFLNSNSFSVSGNAGKGGAILLQATGGISTGFLDSASLSSVSGNAREGGDITLQANGGSIKTGYLNSFSSASGNTGKGGAILLQATSGRIDTGDLNSKSSSSNSGNAGAGGDITLQATSGIFTGDLNSFSSSNLGNAGKGGAILLQATGGKIDTGFLDSNSYSISGNAGNGGAILLQAIGDISTGNLYSNSYSLANSGNAGDGGAILLQATGGSIKTGGLNSFSYSNYGNAGRGGDITLQATNTIHLLRYQYYENDNDPNTTSFQLVPGSGSINSTGKVGSGDITITSDAPFAYDDAIITSDTFGSGKGGNILIIAPVITLSGGAQLSASTHSNGLGGNITLRAADKVKLTGASVVAPEGIFSSPIGGFSAIPPSTYLGGYIPTGNFGNRILSPGTQFPSGVFTQTTVGSTGSAGNLRIETGELHINNGAAIATTTFGKNSNAGNISVQSNNSISITNGSILSGVAGDAIGNSGNIDLSTRSLAITGGGTVQTQTLGQGIAGNIQVNATNAVTISGIDPTSLTPSGLRSGSGGSNTQLGTASNNIGQGGDIKVTTGNLRLADKGVLDSQTVTNSRGGNIIVNATQSLDINQASLLAESKGASSAGEIKLETANLTARNGTITTSSDRSAGGKIAIDAGKIRLDESDITTNVSSGAGGGGDIYLEADSILAFGDSDILAFARDGTGGAITFATPAFFGENYRPAPSGIDPDTLKNNQQVDINASGAISGIVTIPDVSFIQNSLSELPENQINTDRLLANSCIVRRNQQIRGSFTVTGTGGLPQRPGDAQISSFPTVDVETIPTSDGTPSTTTSNRSWQKGDPIVEPQGIYQLPNGKLVLSRECL